MSLGRLVGKLANVSRCNDTTNMGSRSNDTPVIGRSNVVSNKKHVEQTTPHQENDIQENDIKLKSI